MFVFRKKFGVLLFLESPIVRCALSPYYRQFVVFIKKVVKLYFVGEKYWSFWVVYSYCGIKVTLFHIFSWNLLNSVYCRNQSIFLSKRRRTPNRCTNEKGGKGLRHFSMKVCEKVQQKGVTTYNEVRWSLLDNFCNTSIKMFELWKQS